MLKFVTSLIAKFLEKAGLSTLGAFVLLAVFFAVGGYGGKKMNDWVVADADFCDACHVHDYANEAWEHSIHNPSNTTCHDCHHQSLYDNAKSLVLLMSPFYKHEGKLHDFPTVNDHICQSCHDQNVEPHIGAIVGPLGDEEIKAVTKINGSLLHKVHLKAENRLPYKKVKWNIPVEDEKRGDVRITKQHLFAREIPPEGKINCRDCHGTSLNRAHSFMATTENCEQCHNAAISENGPHMHNQNCLLCHVAGFISHDETPATSDDSP